MIFHIFEPMISNLIPGDVKLLDREIDSRRTPFMFSNSEDLTKWLNRKTKLEFEPNVIYRIDGSMPIAACICKEDIIYKIFYIDDMEACFAIYKSGVYVSHFTKQGLFTYLGEELLLKKKVKKVKKN